MLIKAMLIKAVLNWKWAYTKYRNNTGNLVLKKNIYNLIKNLLRILDMSLLPTHYSIQQTNSPRTLYSTPISNMNEWHAHTYTHVPACLPHHCWWHYCLCLSHGCWWLWEAHTHLTSATSVSIFKWQWEAAQGVSVRDTAVWNGEMPNSLRK